VQAATKLAQAEIDPVFSSSTRTYAADLPGSKMPCQRRCIDHEGLPMTSRNAYAMRLRLLASRRGRSTLDTVAEASQSLAMAPAGITGGVYLQGVYQCCAGSAMQKAQ